MNILITGAWNDWLEQRTAIEELGHSVVFMQRETDALLLSADFPAVRIDLYSIRGQIIFGEMTFFPWSGYMNFRPDSFDLVLGDRFVLPHPNYAGKELGQ